MSKKEEDAQTIEMKLNPNLTTTWVDGVSFNLRDDNICLMRFMSTLPEGVYEQSRLMTSKEVLVKIAESLCLSLDYYPKKPKK